MARKSKEQRWQEVAERAHRFVDDQWSAQRAQREECLADRRFYSVTGAMWEGPLEDQYENKPKFEVNKVHLAVIRIVSEYRASRIAPDFRAKDQNTDLAETCAGLFRADEQDCRAQEALDNAFEEAIGGGMGAWRLRATNEDEADEDGQQRIVTEPIYDADTCVFLDGRRQDKSDSRKGCVLTGYTRDAFMEDWPDEDVSSWERPSGESVFDWSSPDTIYTAEYYEVEKATRPVYIYRGPLHDDTDPDEIRVPEVEHKDEERVAELEATGYVLVRTEEAQRRRVHKWIISGGGVLEDCGIIAGEYIPIVVTYGKRWFVDGIERMMGHVRLAKDPSRLKNMQISKLAEISALSSVEKQIVLPEQILGHGEAWARDNIDNAAYLQLNPIIMSDGTKAPSGPVGKTSVPQVPPATVGLIQATEQDIKDVLGSSNPADEIPTNVAQQTLEMAQNRADTSSIIYMDNFAVARRWGAVVWMSKAKDVYVEEGREMKTVPENGDAGRITLLAPGKENGQLGPTNDLRKAKMDVVVDVGPSFTTRRDSTVRAATALLTALTPVDPEAAAACGSLILQNLDGEGLKDVKAWDRKRMVARGVYKPTPEEEQEMAQAQANASNQPPSPGDQLQLAAAEQATAEAASARAGTAEKIASAGLKDAQAEKTRAEIPGVHNDQVLATAKAHHEMTQPPPPPPGQQPPKPPADA